MSREPTAAVSKRKYWETVKKRNPYAEAIKIRKHHPYEYWLKMRKKMDEVDMGKKNETNVFAELLSKVMPTGPASNVAPPPTPLRTPQKMRRGTQSTVTSASVSATPPPPPFTEYKYVPAKQECVEEDDVDQVDYNEDDNFFEDESLVYGKENVGTVASPYKMPYVYKRHFHDPQYGVRKDGNMLMIGYSPVVVDASGDNTIKDRVFKGSKGLWNC